MARVRAEMAERQVAFAVVGGGQAGFNCARWLREEGADGEVVVIGREPDAPYYRPDCSKDYLRGEKPREEVMHRPPEWYEEQRIEVQTKVSVTGLDPAERVLSLSNGDQVKFDKALIATGANVTRLSVPGCELAGIHYLRTLGNSEAIREHASGKRAVLIGGSYIASEVAASLTELGSSCTLVMLEPVALSRTFGEQAGRFFQGRLEEHGIRVHGNDALQRFEGADGRVTKVVTKRGEELDADAVVIGAGVMPEVTLARAAGLELGEFGGVVADSRLATSVPGVYVAGDIAEYDSVVHRRRLRVEHWDVAFNQGKTAALNMLGRDQPHDVVPYFFSDLSDWASLEYVGPASQWDHEIVRGSIDDGEFSIFYLDGGRVAAALSVGRSDIEHASRLITSHEDISDRVSELADPASDLASI
jgi:3-phenylpropionate/trans-cinnamate dioxygenase ferredoxin reductase subunit